MVVLSVSPLLGSGPYTDPSYHRWLHAHVRPSVKGLMRMLRTSATRKGGLLGAMRQLQVGHRYRGGLEGEGGLPHG